MKAIDLRQGKMIKILSLATIRYQKGGGRTSEPQDVKPWRTEVATFPGEQYEATEER